LGTSRHVSACADALVGADQKGVRAKYSLPIQSLWLKLFYHNPE